MAKRTKIDELNILNSDTEQEDTSFDYKDYIEHYFDPMQISEKQRRERIEEAEELFDAVLLFLIWCEENPENVQIEDTKREMENLYKEVIFQKVEPDDYIDIYVQFFISNLVDVTTKNQGDEYFTSVERTTNIACNEANSVVNYSEVQTAKRLGYLYKQWVAELDERTRLDHVGMNGKIIPIDAYFVFNDCEMIMPHDEVNGTARQCVNCRCSMKYLTNNINQRFEDATESFKIKSETFDVELDSSYTDKDGNTYYVDGKKVIQDHSDKEYEIAKLLKAKLGGDISLVPRVLVPQNIKTPDYIYRGESLDLKEIKGNSKNALYNAIHKKKRQSKNFVFDVSESELTTEDFINQMESLYKRNATGFVDKTILVRDNEIVRILQKRK